MSKKENILNAATRLFAEKGFKETTVAELSKMTGAAEGTIFHHFKSKEDIFMTILKLMKDGITQEFKEYIASQTFDTGLDMVEKVISFYLYLAAKNEDWFLILHRNYPYELAKNNAQCREHLEAIYNCFAEFFELAMILGQKDGSIQRNLNARKIALILFSTVNGLVWFNINSLYDAGALYQELIESCRKILLP